MAENFPHEMPPETLVNRLTPIFFGDLFALAAAAATFALFHIHDSPTRKEKIFYATGYIVLFLITFAGQALFTSFGLWWPIGIIFLWSLYLEIKIHRKSKK